MKSKKEIVILVLIIAALTAYIVSEKRGSVHYLLPEVNPIAEKDVTKLTIHKGESDIVLHRENDEWVILPQKFLAEENVVKAMVEGIGSLTLTALASESKSYPVYELDDEHKVQVELYGGEEVLRKIEVGKAASSAQHTFVKLDGDHRVFHARGNLKITFDKSIAELRNKNVLTIDEEISEVNLKQGDKETTLLRASTPVSVDVAQAEAGEKLGEVEGQEEPPPTWRTHEDLPAKEREVDDIINSLSQLQCNAFVEDKTKEDLTSPLYEVTLKGLKDYTFAVFEKVDSQYIATSSESDYPFFIPEWKAQRVMKDPDTLAE